MFHTVILTILILTRFYVDVMLLNALLALWYFVFGCIPQLTLHSALRMSPHNNFGSVPGSEFGSGASLTEGTISIDCLCFPALQTYVTDASSQC